MVTNDPSVPHPQPAESATTAAPHTRRRKLPLPRLQLRLIGAFTGLSALSLVLQFVLVSGRLAQLAAHLPAGGEYLVDALPGLMLSALGLSVLVLLPLTVALGVAITFRWAGPLYRMQVHLAQVIEERAQGPCRIREGDELQELCALLNDALAAERRRGASAPRAPDENLREAA
jgi:hypothetical protein